MDTNLSKQVVLSRVQVLRVITPTHVLLTSHILFRREIMTFLIACLVYNISKWFLAINCTNQPERIFETHWQCILFCSIFQVWFFWVSWDDYILHSMYSLDLKHGLVSTLCSFLPFPGGKQAQKRHGADGNIGKKAKDQQKSQRNSCECLISNNLFLILDISLNVFFHGLSQLGILCQRLSLRSSSSSKS